MKLYNNEKHIHVSVLLISGFRIWSHTELLWIRIWTCRKHPEPNLSFLINRIRIWYLYNESGYRYKDTKIIQFLLDLDWYFFTSYGLELFPNPDPSFHQTRSKISWSICTWNLNTKRSSARLSALRVVILVLHRTEAQPDPPCGCCCCLPNCCSLPFMHRTKMAETNWKIFYF